MRGLVCLCFTQVKQIVFTGFYFENTWVKHSFIFPTEHWNDYTECKLEIYKFAMSFKREILSISTYVFFGMKKQF